MYTYPWYHWITFFYIYCFFGWIFESSFVSFETKHFVNRGFLRIPMLPLYGTGAIMMLWVSLPFKDNLLLVYLSGVVGATILEYITGYMMERLFKMKYWDYSHLHFQFRGYICLSSSIAWGFLTILMTHVIHVPIANFVLSLKPVIEFSFLGIVSVFFVSDTIKSVKEAIDLSHALEALTKVRTELDEIQVQLSLLKSETTQKVGVLRGDAAQMIADKEQALSEQMKALNEKRRHLSQHMSVYRKGILRGNPTASSKKFAAALKELKESINTKYS